MGVSCGVWRTPIIRPGALQPIRRARGAADGLLVEREEPLGEVGHRELVGPLAGPRRPAAARRAGSSSSAPQRLRGARRRRPAAPAAPRGRRGTRCGSRRCRTRPPGARRHRLEQHHAERLAVERREARDGGAAQPGLLLLVGDPPEPLDPRRPRGRAARPVCGPSPTTQSVGVAVEAGERVEQHRQALARLVPADEEDRRRAPTASTGPVAKLGDLDAVRARSRTRRRTSG